MGVIGFSQKAGELQKLRQKFVKMVGIEAVAFSKERFVKKNWVDKNAEAWKPNAKPLDWVPKKWRKRRGSLLVDSGRLKRSVRVLNTTQNSVTIGTDVPYAQIHNEGGTMKQTLNIKPHTRKRKGRTESVKGHTRSRRIRIPKRQFIGNSAMLTHRIERLMQIEIIKIIRK